MKLSEINHAGRTSQFEPTDIIRIQAQSNYCKIYFINQCKTLVVAKVLRLVQEKLPPDMFVRVHRSHLVNRMYIKALNGMQHKTLELINGETVAVSRRKRTAFGKAPFL